MTVKPVPLNMGHVDAVEGALCDIERLLREIATSREWDECNAKAGEAWASLTRAVGYLHFMRRQLPEGEGEFG